MKRTLLFIAAACSRPVERRTPPPVVADTVVIATVDAAPAGVPAGDVRASDAPTSDAPTSDAPTSDAPTSVMATVSHVDVVGADTFIVLAAGSADGVQPGWRVTFIVDREVPPCPIVRVSRHETVCKWNQTFLPSRVVRLEP